MNILSTFLLLIIVSTAGWSQQYAVFVETTCSDVDVNSVDISGTEHAVNTNAAGTPQISFYFKNTSGTTKAVTISRTALCVPAEWSNELSWAPACLDPSFQGTHYSEAQIDDNWESISITIPNDSLGILVSAVDFGGGASNGKYRYYFRSNGVILDSVDLKINNDCSLGIGEQGQEAGLSVYPNPAADQLTVSTFGITGNAVLRITDIFGKLVCENQSTDPQLIRTSTFESGVYFISILENGIVLKTNRVLVKH